MYYAVDKTTGKPTSLHTTNEDEARQIIEARNNSERQPALSLHIARSYLVASDPAWMQRTWQDVVDEFCSRGNEETQRDRRRVSKRHPQNLLLGMKLLGDDQSRPY
jgi:hypothetical protein